MKPLLTIAQVCERLQLGEAVVRRLLSSGELPAARIGRSWRVDEARLEAYIASREHNRPVVRVFDADNALTAVLGPVEEEFRL